MSSRDTGTRNTGLSPSGLKAHPPPEAARRARRFGSFYFAEHVLRSMRGYGWTIVASSVGTPVVYLFAMGIGLASLVDARAGNQGIGDVSYLTFVAPALLVTAAIMVANEEFSYPVMAGFKWRRIYHGPNASPLSSSQIATGHLMAVAVRLIFTCGIYFLIMMLFGAVPEATGWLAAVVAVVCGLSFGLPLMAYAAGIEEEKGQFPMVMRFVVTPLFLFSGTVFPLDSLPMVVRWIGWLSPLWHGTELGRVFSYDYAEPVWLSVVHVVYLVALALAGWAIAKRRYTRRLGK
ncbi:ABC transporter permease [Arthrobacter castelli]|uniref:ABC transporter permease n=1 Tax=Arthrobacter castelli TaxID=271431 RepID=UPI00040E6F39|nr:ABC transporter permease [Arthrobacter castelli]